ncbi:MAG: Asp-tRNA(Asn)/Glu-tRNA(Gln) amidotransferase subunit GatC [Bryobacteraceae bacterium]
MKITEKEVRYVAELANLELSDAEVNRFQADLDEILGHVARLNEVDTNGVEPMAQVLYAAGDDGGDLARLRDDCERPPLGTDLALANAPQAGAGYFKVPKVIER